MTSYAKCARCSKPVTHDSVISADDVFHSHCWRVLASEIEIAESRKRIESGQDRVRKSLDRLRMPRSPTAKPQPVCPVCLESIERPHSLIHEQCDYTFRPPTRPKRKPPPQT